MEVKVLGTGCPKCKKVIERAEEAIKELGLDVKVEKVDKINDIMSYGVMMTPALVINGEVKCAGKLPTVDDIKNWLQEEK